MSLNSPTLAQFPPKLQCLFQPKRYKVLWGGRATGRSWGCARALLITGLQRPIRVLCVREFQNSIEESVHKILSDQISLLNLEAFYKIEKAHIYGLNGTSFSFEGIKNNTNRIKSYEGIDYCWAEEAVKISRASWGVLIPTIRKENSEIWLTFNPESEKDYTYRRFVLEKDDSMIVEKMTYADNPWLPEVMKEEMERDRERDPDYYLNVWEGHCRQILEGAVYAKELRRATEENRICTVPWAREWPVDTFWDLGRGDATAIWFVQRVAMQYRVLGFFQDTGEDITYFIRELQRREFTYGRHWLPHDGKAKRLGSKRTIQEMLAQAYPGNVYIVPKLSIEDGINAARIIFPNCWFDQTKCEEGLRALRAYHYQVVDEENNEFSQAPVHDWASDAADAFRYMAIALQQRREAYDIGKRLARPPSVWLKEGLSNLGWMA